MVIWIIGLSGSGKSTVARELETLLREARLPLITLDGDAVREVWGDNLGHSIEARRENSGRIQRLGRFLEDQGLLVVTAILSIFPEHQRLNRTLYKDYFQVYLRARLEDVERRDIKRIYAEARAGRLASVVGIDLRFPEPEGNDLVLDNDFVRSPRDLALAIFSAVRTRLEVGPRTSDEPSI